MHVPNIIISDNNMKYVVLFCFIFSIGNTLGQTQNCNDCKTFRDCPSAAKLLQKRTPETDKKLKEAFCGHEGKSPKVCCLNFHPNLELLPKNCGEYDGNRIIGGRVTGLYEFPWMTLIAYNTRDGTAFKCGGTVINSRYILTAAHCIKDVKIAGIRVGDHNTSTETDCQGVGSKMVCESRYQDIRVAEAIMHEGYQGRPHVRNDIGLLRLENQIDLSLKNAKPVCLPVTSSLRGRDTAYGNGTIAGWGYTETGYTSDTLLSTNVPVFTKQRCSALYDKNSRGTEETDNKLCAGANGKDSCGGDSGGPLMLTGSYDNKDRYIQYGIVSYGPRLCGSDYPGVYTDITKYMDWILDNIRP